MTALDIFALVVLLVLAISTLAVMIILARLPGQLARKRGHSKAEAINVAGWLGFLNGVSWLVAMVWAFTESLPEPPLDVEPSSEKGADG